MDKTTKPSQSAPEKSQTMAEMYAQRVSAASNDSKEDLLSEQDEVLQDESFDNQQEPSENSKGSSTATAFALLAAGGAAATVGVVAANTKVETKGGVLSSDTNLGPLSSSGYAGVNHGDAVNGKSSAIDLGFASSSQSEQHSFGLHGAGTTKSSGWNIGGVGCNNTTHQGVGEKGKLFNYKTEGNFLGHDYKWGFNVPTPHISAPNIPGVNMSKMAQGVADTANHAGNVLGKAGPGILSAGHSTIGFVAKHGPKVVDGAVKVGKVVGPVIVEGAGLLASVLKK